ncbi:MAG: 4-hydroxythreonine-4-phosphate dehydrogenase PdxA [Deltaproteobacteria bacterium]|nr:4-hydroxythreonine-4-phosphate dehydrogenase PdxA [Deltaproteobacteria bacterium]
MYPLRIGLTQGDPKGVGPELCARALAHFAKTPHCTLHLYGDPQRTGPDTQLSDGEAGRLSAMWIAHAVQDCRDGRLDALVTAPINKSRWHSAGIRAPGHTEFLATLAAPTNPPDTRMLFLAPRLRIVLLTTHVPLQAVPALITAENIRRTVETTQQFFTKYLGLRAPRIACLGLNPHAGEAGLLGTEELQIISPTLETLRRDGVTIDGPFPADTYFAWNRQANAAPPHDIVLAMYHDQGLLPIKTLDPLHAVNVTMGLPFLRVSPGHGTAESIAGTGRVDATNFFAAIETALTLARTAQREHTL